MACREQTSVLSDWRTLCLHISILGTRMERAIDPEARVHVLVQLKTDMSALNEMDRESYFVG